MYKKSISEEHLALTEALRAARANLKQHLAARFPAGAACAVILNSRQLNPTPATVVEAIADHHGGHVLVRLQAKVARRRPVTRSIAVDLVTLIV